MSSLVRFRFVFFATALGLLLFPQTLRAQDAAVDEAETEQAAPANEEEFPAGEGQEDLDAATTLKLSASSMADLEKVIELCESSIKKGLTPESEDLAESLVTATLFQHGSRFAQALFDPRERNQRPQMLKKFALTDLYKILEYNEELPQVHMMIARLEAVNVTGQRVNETTVKKGIASAERAIELLEDDNELRSKALVLRAGYARKNLERMQYLDQAIEADSGNMDAWRLRGKNRLVEGEMLSAAGQLDLAKQTREKAIEDFSKLLDENPDDPDALQAVAELMSRLGNNEEALAKADQAISKNPRAPSLLILRGRIRHEEKNYEGAIKDYNRAIDLQPDSHIAHLDRMESHYDNGDKEAAAKDYGKARELLGSQGFTRAVFQRVLVRAQNKNERAITQLKRIVDIDGLNAKDTGRQPELDYILQLAERYSATQQPMEAIESYTMLLDAVGNKNSGNSREFRKVGLNGRANAYLGIGKHSEAIQDYETVLKLDPDADSPLNNLAWVLATSPTDELRDGERAVELATKACEVTKYDAPHILSTLAAGYAETGDFEEAVKRSTEAVDKMDARIEEIEEAGQKPTALDLETQKQLKNELMSYEEKKPWREKQDMVKEEEAEKKPAEDASSEQTN